jgi:hypothetical protein
VQRRALRQQHKASRTQSIALSGVFDSRRDFLHSQTSIVPTGLFGIFLGDKHPKYPKHASCVENHCRGLTEGETKAPQACLLHAASNEQPKVSKARHACKRQGPNFFHICHPSLQLLPSNKPVTQSKPHLSVLSQHPLRASAQTRSLECLAYTWSSACTRPHRRHHGGQFQFAHLAHHPHPSHFIPLPEP